MALECKVKMMSNMYCTVCTSWYTLISEYLVFLVYVNLSHYLTNKVSIGLHWLVLSVLILIVASCSIVL